MKQSRFTEERIVDFHFGKMKWLVRLSIMAVIIFVFLTAAHILRDQKPVVLSIDINDKIGLFSPYTDFSEGGIREVTDPLFWKSTLSRFTQIGPKLIRIDHIFDTDYYGVVHRNDNGTLEYDWRKLDDIISEILAAGAKPFLCLSYMPLALTSIGSPYGTADNITEWKALNTELVKHMIVRFGLKGLYYEVWNEPDLEEFWKSSQDDYFDLYHATVEAIKGSDPLAKVGGPAVTQSGLAWLDPFLRFVEAEKLQLDFVSWHNYDSNPITYSQEIRYVKDLLSILGFSSNIETLITEWNMSGSLNMANDAFYNAGHTAAVLSEFHDENLSKAFFFSLRDSQESQQLYGGWGLIAYDGNPKPSFNCFDAYSRLRNGERLRVATTDDDVKAFAVLKDNNIKSMIWNYSIAEKYGTNREINLRINLKGSFLSEHRIAIKTYIIGNQDKSTLPYSGNHSIDTYYVQAGDEIEKTVTLENGGVLYIDISKAN